ncbi:2'-5' RNA ligase family protein [Promicromonospora sp. MEB111]|uniref:2'-5' RNA ligase family protein n=1 Tax=Promicromonospora sp. MEB111 TaxID=3040301 RepID=UPI00254AB36E|nr:2'-5' RNA ligase family protein [Promicromonospora sp. MEB111]
MIDSQQRVGVSFAVEGEAADDAVRLNAALAQSFDSQIRLGAGGNSSPHVTIALGEADRAALASIIAVVDKAVRDTKPFRMSFGQVARETVTGRYVLADVVIPVQVAVWRSTLHAKITEHLSGVGRTTDDPHLTIAVVDGQESAVDRLLANHTDKPLADCRVTHVDVARAGARGAKGTVIERFVLGAA